MLDPDTAQSEKISEVHAFSAVVLIASHPSLFIFTSLSSFCVAVRPACSIYQRRWIIQYQEAWYSLHNYCSMLHLPPPSLL
jgi:hypothetical protein